MNRHRLLIVPISLCLAAALQAKDAPSPKPSAVVRPWPAADKAAGFAVEQVGEERVKTFTVTAKQTGEKITFEAINRGSPDILEPHNGWPQIGVIIDGPPEFLWRALYRMENGAYRCVRIDEFTRNPFHAPADAPVIEISPGYRLRFLRSRDTKEGDADYFESFTTETPSPDGKTSVRFAYEPTSLVRVEIASALAKDDDPQVIYNSEEEGYIDAISFALWRPDNGAFAFYLTVGPRLYTTRLVVKTGAAWKMIELPEVNLPLGKEWNVHRESVRPLRWTDTQTLVLLYSGDYYDHDRNPGSYYFHVTLRWGKDGIARVVSVKKAPEPKAES